MRLKKRICAMLLLTAVLIGSLCSCGLFSDLSKDNNKTNTPSGGLQISELDRVSTKTAPAPVIPAYSGKNTLTCAVNDEVHSTVSPFFYDTESGRLAADLSHVKLVTLDRSGFPVTKGKNGQTVSYLGNEYTYYTASDVTVTINDDGTAEYDFDLREDIFFSDGTNMTADDVIFSMYVLLDPSYTGYSKLSQLPISGLDAYFADMSCLGDIIYDSVVNNSAADGFSEADKQKFSEKLGAAQQIYITQLLGRIFDSIDKKILLANAGKWADSSELEQYLGAITMVMYGYAVWEKNNSGEYTGTLITANGNKFDCIGSFPSHSELFACIAAETDSLLDIDDKHPEGDLDTALRGAFGSSYEHFFEVRREMGKSSASVSGITKTGMYSLRVTLDRYDVSDIYAFSIYVAPLHVYGNREEYKYTEQRFGFVKGDLRSIKNKNTQVCSGAYFYRGRNGEAYRFERNKLYYLGCPYVTYVDLVRSGTGEDIVAAIAEGKYDIAQTELTEAVVSSAAEINKDKTSVALTKYGNGEYAYIGLRSDLLRIGEDPSSSRSISLRRAFCVLFSYYADSIYNGDICEVSYRASGPLEVTPSALDGADEVYGKNLFGEDICTEDMTAKEKEESLRVAVLGYFVQAGYTIDKNESKIEASADGSALEFTILLNSEDFYSEYVRNIAENVQKLLSDIGITLNIEYAKDTQDMHSTLSGEGVRMWSFVRELSAVPDMASFYSSKNTPKYREGTGGNYCRISDKTVDALLAEAAITADPEARAQVYRKIFDKVCEYSAEVPLCIGYNALLHSPASFEQEDPLAAITRYYSWTDIAHELRLSAPITQ